jgi:hypothetical protein
MVTAGLTVTVSACGVLPAPVLSVTVTAKLNGVTAPTEGAVPLRVAPFKVSQAGRFVAENVNPDVPPVSARSWLYGRPDVVGGNEFVVMDGAGLIVSAKVLVATPPRLSVTFRVKLTWLAVGGIPLSTPTELMVSQFGSVAPLSVKV